MMYMLQLLAHACDRFMINVFFFESYPHTNVHMRVNVPCTWAWQMQKSWWARGTQTTSCTLRERNGASNRPHSCHSVCARCLVLTYSSKEI